LHYKILILYRITLTLLYTSCRRLALKTMSAFAINRRGKSACPQNLHKKVSDLDLPRHGSRTKLTKSQINAKKIKRELTRDHVGEILNPGAIKTKFVLKTNHIKGNAKLIKTLESARVNRQLAKENADLIEKEKEKFKMPRFVAVPSSDLIPNVFTRDEERRKYKEKRNLEIEQKKKEATAAKRAASEDLSIVIQERNKIVEEYTSPKRITLKTREVLLGNHLTVAVAETKKADSNAYRAPSHKGPRGPEYAVRGRGDATSPRRPQTAPSRRRKKKIQKLPEHLNVPCWWANQASAWELLHVGEEGC
jgi:hypothetical protein